MRIDPVTDQQVNQAAVDVECMTPNEVAIALWSFAGVIRRCDHDVLNAARLVALLRAAAEFLHENPPASDDRG